MGGRYLWHWKSETKSEGIEAKEKVGKSAAWQPIFHGAVAKFFPAGLSVQLYVCMIFVRTADVASTKKNIYRVKSVPISLSNTPGLPIYLMNAGLCRSLAILMLLDECLTASARGTRS